MTQEDKELLLKDLCARLPYKVKVTTTNPAVEFGVISGVSIENKISVRTKHADIVFDCTEVKPYLFPLSSITEEQEKELSKLGVSYGEYALHDDTRGLGIMINEAYIFFEFCYKHHIDLGLIGMGLANDATGLNIY